MGSKKRIRATLTFLGYNIMLRNMTASYNFNKNISWVWLSHLWEVSSPFMDTVWASFHFQYKRFLGPRA
jgi:hypothetical protein